MFARLKWATGFIISLGVVTAGKPTAWSAETPRPAEVSFFENLMNQAKASAKEKFREPTAPLPEFLRDMSYDGYMGIKFRREKSLWHGEASRFQIQLFHPGYLFRQPVRIHVMENGKDREIPFSQAMFDYGQGKFPPFPTNLFLTGLRVLYPVNQPAKMDEVAVFLGSSFFRILGTHQVFGTSARGLAIDTAEASGEEFPSFTEFWIQRPGPQAEQIQLFARLESRRVAGAYQFLIKPGEATVVDVEACLFFREKVKKVGLAPLTGMYLFGENHTRYFPDFRPEVHDADGLLIETTSHAWEWRPLVNPPKVHQISVFTNVASFGLLQRDRNGDHYQDLEGRFERRPAFWIVPEGNWGAGRVELVEIPSTEERNDNIVAYWSPDQSPSAGQEFRFRYKLRAFLSDRDLPPTALLRAQDTRLQPGKNGRTRFVIDFAGGRLPSTSPAPVAKVQASKGKLENIVTQANDMIDGWRTFFDLISEGDKPIELRLWLEQGNQAVSETWVYHHINP